MSDQVAYMPTEIDWGSFELSQEPVGQIGTMWVSRKDDVLTNYFVLLDGVVFPIPVTPTSPLTFLAVELGAVTSPEQFYEASLKYLQTDKVSRHRTVEVITPWS